MGASISGLVRDYRSVSIIGMCKNAGKTTVLNRLVQELSGHGQVLALTSIGRDGEDKDLVTGTKKPGIWGAEGTLIATASDLVVRHCDMTREILASTGISTPMGEVVLFRARSDGSVQLAGPSATSQLARIREEFFRLGAHKVIIDGALSRKTLCSRAVTEGTILCTGASYHKDIHTVVEDTAYQCRVLTLPETADGELRRAAGCAADPRDTILLGEAGPWTVPPGMPLGDALRSPEAAGTRAVFFGGALTDHLIKPLILSSDRLEGIRFVVRDSSKILLKPDSWEKLGRRGVVLEVLDSVNLVAVAVNPFSAYGFHFAKEELMDRMEARVGLPVLNVQEDAL